MIAWLWLTLWTSAGAGGDLCVARLPAEVTREIGVSFPAYALPRVAHNLTEDIANNRQHGGDGCLGAAYGDFDGDGTQDVALLLASPKDDHVLVVVALWRDGKWQLEQLRTWKSERNRIYVAVAPPGKYKRSESFDYPLSEAGEVESLESTLPGIVTGRTEASGIYYFLKTGSWKHVWAID